MNTKCIEVSGLSKSFHGRKAVDGISFSVEKGQVFGLLGHNGAGKSTTIEMILGLQKPDSGNAWVLGKEAAKDRKELFEKVGVQFQSSHYQEAIRVDEVCREHAVLYRHPKDYRELLDTFGLTRLEKSRVTKLSGGERQKLSVVLALIGDPEIVFLDELTTGLDVAARREVWRTLKHLKDSGLTYLQSAFASLVSVGICCSAFMSIPIVIVDYRDKKILKHFYCSPCSPAWLLGADTICSAVMAVISAILVSVTAILCFGYRMQGNWVEFIGVWGLTLISMFSIGLMIASVCRTVKTMNAVTSLVYFPMLFLSGATIPYELFPKGLQKVADVMPLTQGIKLMKAASVGNTLSTSLYIVILLVTITVICSMISVKTFRWE